MYNHPNNSVSIFYGSVKEQAVDQVSYNSFFAHIKHLFFNVNTHNIIIS